MPLTHLAVFSVCQSRTIDNSEVLWIADELAERNPNARKAINEASGHGPGYEQPQRSSEAKNKQDAR